MDTDDLVDLVLDVGARIGGAALVLAGGYLIAFFARRYVHRLLAQPKIASALGPSTEQLLKSAVFYVILALSVAASLISLGVSATTVATVIVILIALIGLALQQSLANFAATVIFLMFQPFKRGELVETMGYMGTVQEILLFNTVLLLPNQRLVSLPNSKVQESGVVNYTRMGHIWSDFSLTVSYGEDLSRVREVITEIAAKDHRILHHPPLAVVVDELGETGVRLLVFPTVAPKDFWDVRNNLREQIKARFDAEGIRFGFPQRDVHLATMPSPRDVIDTDAPSHH